MTIALVTGGNRGLGYATARHAGHPDQQRRRAAGDGEREAGRIVNVSSVMGSLTDQADPASPYFALTLPAYQSSKAALNNVTIALAKQLTDTAITVTSVCPGFVQTDLSPINRDQAPLTADDAAATVVRAATTESAATGAFVDADGRLPW